MRCTRTHRRHQPAILDNRYCSNIPKPNVAMQESCSIMACHGSVTVKWKVAGWSECSKSCGEGSQSRIVSCVNSYGQPSDGCVESSRPQNTQSCNSGECLPTPLGQTECVDKYPWCYLVPRRKVCGDPLYSEHCCKSCSSR